MATIGVPVTPEVSVIASPELEKMVAGALALVIAFDGPSVFQIGATPYSTLCSHGIKAEGERAPWFGMHEALKRYEDQLRAMAALNEGKQLAWRRRPVLEKRADGEFRVYSRLAFI